jgi:CubicO group peptidase (beta-lactamase class C family)
MQEQVFAKYNLSRTRTTTFSAVVQDRAAGYVYKQGEGISNATNYLALRPSGAFLSTIDDMLRWEVLIQQHQLLSKSNWELMWTDTVRTAKASQDPIEYYGYGWDVSEYHQRRVVHHDGTIPGFTSSYFRFIDSKTAIIVLTNADNAYPKTVALRIADILFQEKTANAK